MTTLPPDQLADALRAQAEGDYGAEAAAELLIAHGTWVRRADFLADVVEEEIVHAYHTGRDPSDPVRWQARCRCGWGCSGFALRDEADNQGSIHLGDLERDNDAGPDPQMATWINWDAIPGFAESAPCSTTEANILRLAAELAGTNCGQPLAWLLSGLDDRNTRLVADAIDHVLTRGGQR